MIFAVVGAAILGIAKPGFADPDGAWLSTSAKNQLVAEIRSASDDLDAGALPDLTEAQQDFLDRANSAEDFLRRKTSPDNFRRWITYLELGDVVEAVQDDAKATTQASRAAALLGRLVGIEPGLELTRLVELRRAARRLVAAVRFRNGERSIEIFTRQLDQLADQVDEFEDVPTADEAAKVNLVLGLLAEANQVPDLRSRLRQTFGQPNFRIHVPESTVQAAVQRNINQSQPVNDCILGTRLFGTANLNGVVGADLRPSIGSVHIVLNLSGQFNSNNRGYNGPVRLNTISNGQVQVTRALHLNEQGAALEPAHAQVSLSSQITSIEHRLRIVRRIAKKRAAEQKPQADAIAKEKLRSQVGQQFIEQTDQAASVNVPDFMADVRPILKRLDLTEPSRRWGSTDQALYIEGRVADGVQLAAANSPPPVLAPVDFAFQLHESVVENTLSPILSGRRFDEDEINNLLKSAGMPARPTSSENQDGDDNAGFELTFSKFRPIIFEARDNSVKIGLRGSRFTQGKRDLKQSLEITATYKPVTATDGSMLLLRDDEVDVSIPGSTSVRAKVIRTAIKDQFSEVFPMNLLSKSVMVPQTVKLPAFRGRVYQVGDIGVDEGWLTIGAR